MAKHLPAMAAQSNSKNQAVKFVNSPQSQFLADLPVLKHSYLCNEAQGAHNQQLIY